LVILSITIIHFTRWVRQTHNASMTHSPRATAIAGLAALAAAVGIGRFAFTPILPIMLADASIDLVRGGWLASANYAGYLAGGITAAAWRGSAADAIRGGLALVAATTLAMALPLGIAAWLVLRAVAGIASAWVMVFTSASVLKRLDDASASDRVRLPGVLYAGVGIGVALAGGVCALALATRHPARVSWIAVGLIACAATALLWNRFPEAPAARDTRGKRAMLPARGWALAACYAAFGFGYIIPATFLSAMAREAARGGALYAASWPLFGLAAAASTWIVTRAAAGRSPRSVWVGGHLVMAAGVAVAALSSGIGAVIACGLLVGGTFMVVTMAGLQEARREAGAQARPMLAAMTSAFALGQIAGPLVVSALAARGDAYAVALWSATGLLVLTAIVLQLLPRSPAP
jgi:predicted MFS family arabinose efflux permease